MANTYITPNWVTTDTATGFLDSTKLIGRFDRQWDDSFFNKPGGAQIGDTVQVRIEQRWTATEGQALQQQAIFNQTVPITVNHQFNVGMGWSSSQKTLEIEEVQSRYTKPAAYIGGMFKSGKVAGASLGMREWYSDPLLPMHTTGTFTASTPAVNGS